MTSGIKFDAYVKSPGAVSFVFECKTNPLLKGWMSRICERAFEEAWRKMKDEPSKKNEVVDTEEKKKEALEKYMKKMLAKPEFDKRLLDRPSQTASIVRQE